MKHQYLLKRGERKLELNSGKLRLLRTERKIPLKDVAVSLGLKTAGGYKRIETGENNLKAEHLPVLAEIFNLDLNELVKEIFFETKLDESSNFIHEN
jgi:transcriptional regulator with XRE-family HTH domain